MDFCLAICTYNRPRELERLLESLWSQLVLPDSLMIVDDGELAAELVAKIQERAHASGLAFTYLNKTQVGLRRGLSESKNLALDKSTAEIVGFLDDDIVLAPGYIAALKDQWQTRGLDPKLIGVGGVIINSRRISWLERAYNKIFALSSALSWDITPQAFQVWDDSLQQVSRGHYAHGGLVSLRREAACRLGFKVFAGGRPALEDVDFSWRAKQAGYYFLLSPDARAFHYHSRSAREGAYLIGFKEGYNRCLIYYQAQQKGAPEERRFWRAQSGWIIRQFLAGHLATGWGMLCGWRAYFKEKRSK